MIFSSFISAPPGSQRAAQQPHQRPEALAGLASEPSGGVLIRKEHKGSRRAGQQQVAAQSTTSTTSLTSSLLEGAADRLKRLVVGSPPAPTSPPPTSPRPEPGKQPGEQQDEQQDESTENTTSTTTTTTKTSTQQERTSSEKRANTTTDWQLERKYTLSEVQAHSSLDDCWMVIFDKVYNITEFVYEHPGGDFILLEYAGRDATHPFLSSRHGSSAYKMLDKYWIGILVDEELYYSNNSSYCSVYSSLSWRSTPTLEVL